MGGTTERALGLLGLLQSRPVWTGPELAARLGVTTRSIRRDVERLRGLGYPVLAAHGTGGGYQLGRGRALPPLLLDDEEAIATALSLRLAAGGTVTGASEAALRALAKLDQVLPARLRAEVKAVQDAVTTLDHEPAAVDPELLLTLARACRDTVRCDLAYVDRAGTPTDRRVEPYRLVATGRRWYLLAFDVDRDDWRTLRLDRVGELRVTTWRFKPRESPDPAAYVARSVTVSPYRWATRSRLHAPAVRVREWIGPAAGTVTAETDETCVLEAGADDLGYVAVRLMALVMTLGCEVEVLEPAELRDELAAMAERAVRASRSASGCPGAAPRPR